MVIIGAGRVGGALAARAEAHGVGCTLLDRAADWAPLAKGSGPIFVATRNDDLDAVLERVPAGRRADLVFIQNGMLRPWLREHKLMGVTRGLLFFAVPARGAPVQPGPASPFAGAHAATVVQFLSSVDLPAVEVMWHQFMGSEVEKLIWNSAFGLLCQAHKASVGQVVERHKEELSSIVTEMQGLCRLTMGVDIEHEALMARLCDFSLTIPDYTGSVKEWRWRNGWFVDTAAAAGRKTPAHHRALAEAGVAF